MPGPVGFLTKCFRVGFGFEGLGFGVRVGFGAWDF